jgi:hypothetical protein
VSILAEVVEFKFYQLAEPPVRINAGSSGKGLRLVNVLVLGINVAFNETCSSG